jgi:hypothetical protein
MYLCQHKAKVHAICVCDTPEYFYNHISEMAVDLGLSIDDAKALITIYPGQGM